MWIHGSDVSTVSMQFPHVTTRLALYFFGKPTPAFEDDAVRVAVTLLVSPKHRVQCRESQSCYN